mmetsp:Transcript_72182/g.205121  ORF Transcript_72182/g.205121 Transcript_72182/m.205121 type:complete len:190 (-) Transcript_72182:523-1092(-)
MQSAMDCDYAPAIFHVGTMFLDGPKNGGFLEKNQKKGIEYYKAAAKLGFAEAQYNLGLLCYYGDNGVTKNDRLALEHTRQAAAQGHEAAQDFLCMIDESYTPPSAQADDEADEDGKVRWVAVAWRMRGSSRSRGTALPALLGAHTFPRLPTTPCRKRRRAGAEARRRRRTAGAATATMPPPPTTTQQHQ